MKHLVVLILMIFCIAIAAADIPANQTLETQGLQTHTDVTVRGSYTESDNIVMQGATAALDTYLEPPGLTYPVIQLPWFPQGWVLPFPGENLQDPHQGVLIDDPAHELFQIGDIMFWSGLIGLYHGHYVDTPGEVQYVHAYNEDTLADSGTITYTKSADIDTRNMPVNQNNFEAEKLVSYIGDSTGQMVSSESLALDTAGNYSRTTGQFLCPFASGIGDLTPQFCNIVEAGSDLSMKQVVLSTKASDRFIAASADIPVALDYEITVSGPGTGPALGDVSAYINVHSREGRMTKIWEDEDMGMGSVYRPGLGSDLSYSEKTSASGAIWTFQKDMSYASGVSRT